MENYNKIIIKTSEKVLRDHNVEVKHVFVLLDREQGAIENISSFGVTVHR